MLFRSVAAVAGPVLRAQTADRSDARPDAAGDAVSGSAETSGDAAERTVAPSDREGATLDVGNQQGLEEKRKAEAKAREAKRLADKKAEEKRLAEQRKRELERADEQKAEVTASDTSSIGKSLLMIDHGNLAHQRIPGITVQQEEPGLDIVKISDESVSEEEKSPSKGGVFGAHTDTIAKWGLLVFVFVIFLIYKARSKRTRRKVVRTITKR